MRIFPILCANILNKFNFNYKTFSKYFLFLNSYHTKYFIPMEKVYMRKEPFKDDLHISFRYANVNFGLDRNFNFCRKVHEKIEDFSSRIRNNIEKEFNKKSKKNKMKKDAPCLSNSSDNTPFLEASINFLCCNKKLENITFAEMLTKEEHQLQLKILDQTLDIVINQPWVIEINLPNTIMAGFMVYPSKLQMQFAEKSYCQAKWFKAKLPASGNIKQVAEWQYFGEGFNFHTTNDAVDFMLKLILIPGNDKGCSGPAVEIISKKQVEVGPGVCPFETRHCFTQQRLKDHSFRVVSYNILADLYADSDYSRAHLFPYCPPYALNIEYRRPLLIKEILGYNADIICLQEVDAKIFDWDLRWVLDDPQQGYKGLYAQKGCSGEGVATFYNDSRFDLIETHNINIGETMPTLPTFETLWEKIKSNEGLMERVCKRSTTLQLVLLKALESDRYLLVANTHLYFHPDADHIRLLQMGYAMLYIEDMFQRILKQYNITNEKHLALIFCGDFNSVPECGIYRLMTEGYVDETVVDWSSKPEECITGVTLKQKFNMQSACGTPPYTNYTHLFAACLDYIFYQSDRLDVEQVVPLPSTEELTAHTAIPSVVFPSDHIALVSDLKFKEL